MSKQSLAKIFQWVIFILIGATLAIPLVINNNFVYPFIFTKAVAFRLLVEIMLVAYLFLAYLSQEFRPKFNKLSLIIILFVLVAFVSSIFGVDFYSSFWGDIERSEGLILWLHLLVYFLILTNVLRQEKDWLKFFDVSLVVGLITCVFALTQTLRLDLIIGANNQRVSAFLGNASFLAGYLLLNLALAAYLFVKKPGWFFRAYYAVLFILFSIVIYKTQTRGAMIGLAAGILVACILVLFKSKPSKAVKVSSLAVIGIIFLAIVFLFFNRQSTWIKSYPTLRRLATISLTDTTTQSRLVTWQLAYRGWTQNPKMFLLGNGMEGFTGIFDKYFPPVIYQDEGSQVWFDRAHNLIFDRAITTGLIGLVLYLIFVFYPIYILFKEYKRDKPWLEIIFISLIVAFFIQDLFVFETITTYIILFFIWAFLANFFPQHSLSGKAGHNRVWLGAAIGSVVLMVFVIPAVNIKPALANIAAAQAMRSDPDANFFEVVNQWQTALESRTYGVPEYRIEFIQYIDSSLANVGEVVPQVKPILKYSDDQIDQQLAQQPNNAINYLLAMRHYNYTFASNPEARIDRLNKALSFFPKLQELTPTRPQIYQEAGYSNLYLYRDYIKKGDMENAKKASEAAENYFQKAVELNPKVVQSHINLIMLYLNQGETVKVQAVLNNLDKLGVDFRQDVYLSQLIDLAINNKNYYWGRYFIEELLKKQPNNPALMIKLALCQAYLGNNQEAIATASQVKELYPPYSANADSFINDVKAGKFKLKN